MESLKGKVALVTGSATGIGAGCALKLAKHGVNLTLVDINESDLKKTAESCRSFGVQVFTLTVDLATESEVKPMLEKAVGYFGHLDILVNSAGIKVVGTIENHTLADYDKVFKINVRSTFVLTQCAVPFLQKTKGNVVNICSISTQKISVGNIAYQMGKGALDVFTRAAALELASKGIRVNGVQPGTVETNIMINMGWSPDASKQMFDECAVQYPMGRIGFPEEIGDCVCFLASDAASFITGELIRVDGGFAAGVMWDQEK